MNKEYLLSIVVKLVSCTILLFALGGFLYLAQFALDETPKYEHVKRITIYAFILLGAGITYDFLKTVVSMPQSNAPEFFGALTRGLLGLIIGYVGAIAGVTLLIKFESIYTIIVSIVIISGSLMLLLISSIDIPLAAGLTAPLKAQDKKAADEQS